MVNNRRLLVVSNLSASRVCVNNADTAVELSPKH